MFPFTIPFKSAFIPGRSPHPNCQRVSRSKRATPCSVSNILASMATRHSFSPFLACARLVPLPQYLLLHTSVLLALISLHASWALNRLRCYTLVYRIRVWISSSLEAGSRLPRVSGTEASFFPPQEFLLRQHSVAEQT